jgi:hypothetical protein
MRVVFETPNRRTATEMLTQTMTFAAIGYSLLYVLLGGGLIGAIVIFVIAKMLGK